MGFEGKTVLVTGSTSGIGRATAERFAGLGASVIVSGRDAGRGEQVVTAITDAGGKARFVEADLNVPDSVLELADQAGEVDVLVNNAGGSPFGGTAEMAVDAVHSVFDVNVIAPFLLAARLAPAMARHGGGVIVNVSSHAAGHGSPILPAYGAAKAGLDSLTRTWAVEFASLGVRVNSVSPGSVRTPPAEVLGEMFDQFANATPLGRAGTPEEIAAVITFLASDDASYITGTVLPVDAGMAA